MKALISLAGLPRAMRIIIYLMVGIIIGMGLVVARIANAISYLSDSPDVMSHMITLQQNGLSKRMTG
jgi:hypothetical protein